MAGINVNSAMNAYQAQAEVSKTKADSKVTPAETNSVVKAGLGKTIGEPKLSEKAQQYYNQLKKKYGQYDFILVSADEKENARANAGKYANNLKTVVLIDEEKIEKMATDEKFRKQYEGILSGATNQIEQIKEAAKKAGASLFGVVMQVNDNGTTSFFAALKKSSQEQKVRIEKKAAKNKAEKKAAEKKAEKKAAEKKAAEKKAAKEQEAKGLKEGEEDFAQINRVDDDTVTIMADSFDGLIRKIEEFSFNERSDSVQTESELLVGQNIDFRG